MSLFTNFRDKNIQEAERSETSLLWRPTFTLNAIFWRETRCTSRELEYGGRRIILSTATSGTHVFQHQRAVFEIVWRRFHQDVAPIDEFQIQMQVAIRISAFSEWSSFVVRTAISSWFSGTACCSWGIRQYIGLVRLQPSFDIVSCILGSRLFLNRIWATIFTRLTIMTDNVTYIWKKSCLLAWPLSFYLSCRGCSSSTETDATIVSNIWRSNILGWLLKPVVYSLFLDHRWRRGFCTIVTGNVGVIGNSAICIWISEVHGLSFNLVWIWILFVTLRPNLVRLCVRIHGPSVMIYILVQCSPTVVMRLVQWGRALGAILDALVAVWRIEWPSSVVALITISSFVRHGWVWNAWIKGRWRFRGYWESHVFPLQLLFPLPCRVIL